MANTPPDKVSAARLAGRQLARLVRLVHRTSTVISEPAGILDRLRTDHPCIVGLWHGQFMMASMYRPDVPVAAMVARHGDAEFIGATMANLGVELVRGAGAGTRKKDRGGASALRGALQCLADGKSFVMTADVPPGPARRCGDGIITLARMSGRPIVPLAVASSRFKSFDTWSRLTINLPYATLAYVYGDPIFVPREANAQELEAFRLRVETELNRVTRRAYELAGADLAKATPRSADPTIPPAPLGVALKSYRSLTRALAPLAPAVLARRAKRGKEDPARQGERLGHPHQPRPNGPLAWVHAASVGELNAVLPLIERIGRARPDVNVLVTTGTVTSANIAAGRLGAGAMHQYAPIDTPQAVAGFLDHWRPDLAVFTESEVWPNLVMATAERCIPMTLVNARMSGRSFRRWKRQRRIAKQLFGRFSLVLAQNAALSRQFAYLGAPRAVAAGNLKIDAPAPPFDADELARLRSIVGSRPVFVAASTHDGEERIVADAHRLMSTRVPGLLTIIAPRHPQRGPELAATFAADGFSVALRSAQQDPSPTTDLYLADTIGELGLFYSLGRSVLLGGSLVPRGGQNPIEAIRLGCAVISGPSRHNFADIYGGLDAAGAVVGVTAAADLADAAVGMLSDEAARVAIHLAGERALSQMSGALEKTLEGLLPLLPALPVAEIPPAEAGDSLEKEPVESGVVQGLRRAVS
jgi:3-deoxy-D-manno-octulosonic-acid transferase